jgi:hypothetical protein
MKILKTIFYLVVLFGCVNLYAQPAKQLPKGKPVKLTVSLDGYKDSSSISPSIMKTIIGEPLKIVNTKGDNYSLSTYQFLYRKIVVSEDEETGKAYNTTSVKSSFFKISPLPTMWTELVREQPRPGEEIIFFDIIVKDSKGIYMYAPNFKITIK